MGELPLKVGRCSNGEFVPSDPSPELLEASRRTMHAIERHARRLRVSRRSFLRSAGGSAAMLLALGACSRDSADERGEDVGGEFRVPESAPEDPGAAADALGGDEFVFDVQTHFLEVDGEDLPFGTGFPQAECGAEDVRDCFTIETFLDEVFLRSDTAMGVISAVPVVADDDPLSLEDMDRARRVLGQLCDDERLLLHGRIRPTIAPLPAVLDEMSRQVEEHPVAAWKAYTHAGGPPWWLDDRDPDLPQVGDAVLAHARDLGIATICVHKGLGGDAPTLSPADVGAAAARHRDLDFVVYHSGYANGTEEGPLDAGPGARSVDRLVRTMDEHGIGPNENVYAELGTTWRSNMTDPTSAAHLLGKLLLAVGEDNLLWGTDSIWYGSPQDQIETFRAFQISESFQERYGYPALTPERKAKVLGGNAARVYGVEPVTTTCSFSSEDLAAVRAEFPRPWTTHGPTTAAAVQEHVASHGWS